MTFETALDVLAGTCFVAGAFLSLAAGVGVLRFPDLLARMHAGTKPQVLGLMLMLLGLEIRLRTVAVLVVIILVTLFQMLTSPVAAHMVGRAGYRTGKVRTEDLVLDDFTADLGAAGILDRREELTRLAADGRFASDGAAPGPEARAEAEPQGD